MIDSNFLEKRQGSLPGQLKNGCFHESCRGIKGTQLKATLVSGFSGMDCPWIDENHPTGWSLMFCALMGKGLTPTFNEANHIIVVTMPRIGVLNIISM